MEPYLKDFKEYMQGKISTPDMDLKLADYYSFYVTSMFDALVSFRTKRQECMEMKDENSKPISAIKADVLADASAEGMRYEKARSHVQILERYLDVMERRPA